MLQLRADGIDDRLRIVPEQDCAHAEVVDQPVAIGIDQMRAFTFCTTSGVGEMPAKLELTPPGARRLAAFTRARRTCRIAWRWLPLA